MLLLLLLLLLHMHDVSIDTRDECIEDSVVLLSCPRPAVRNLMTRYGIADPTANLGVGVFSTDAFQQMYDSLLAQGRVSLAAAYDVGETVELDDVEELAKAAAGVTAPNVVRVYSNLLAGSERHLAEFQAQ